MATVNVYLTFNGNCEEVFNFYKSVFGGVFPYVGRFGDMPPSEDSQQLSETEKSKIMHISLPISEETILMGSDVVGEYTTQFQVGNNIALSVNANTKEEADAIFNGLSSGGKVTMPIQDTFWGAYFGMFTDQFGINWMVNYDDPAKVQPH